jgi:hypothetical protein
MDSLQTLNDLLNRLNCSLLQYIGESWPWMSHGDSTREEIFMALVRRQHFGAERLAELLVERRAVIEIGNYPWDGSSLHYVTLDFVKPKLMADEQSILQQLNDAVPILNGDAEAVRLVEQLIADEEQAIARLQAL